MNDIHKSLMDRLEGIPEHCRYGVANYIVYGTEPGGFLTAVICNNLVEAFGCADTTNRENMFAYANALYNVFPSGSWRNRKAMESWMERGGLTGQQTPAPDAVDTMECITQEPIE